MSAPMTPEEFMKLVEITETGCWEWRMSRNIRRGGYGQKRIGGRKDGRVIGSHRLAWWVFHGYEPIGNFVCHRCDNPPCCNPDHLFLGDPKINVQDMHSKDRGYVPETTLGEAHHSSKLTEKDVVNIRFALDKGERLSSLSKKYGVTKQAIWRIKRGESWAWLKIQ